MRRIIACALGVLALQGCAAGNELSPSFLGALVLEDDDDKSPLPNGTTPEALDHVQSNKVLGAMAYQKVTGRTVAPERLTGK